MNDAPTLHTVASSRFSSTRVDTGAISNRVHSKLSWFPSMSIQGFLGFRVYYVVSRGLG
jgi:hypothetical protein